MHTNTYTIVFTPAPEGGYSVNCLELPACSQGETLEEAREMITDAIQLILADLRDRERKAAEPGSWEETLVVTG